MKNNEKQELTVWDDAQEIKKLFAPSLSDKEFQLFLQLGKSIGANPFTREIFAVKYKDNPASIFLGRDFYRRKAQELPEYDGHTVDAVYTKDQFLVENNTPRHSYSLSNRGNIVGAYCLVYRKNARIPYYVFVEFSEYNTGMSVWKQKPATMIKKVAEAQGLRGAFQGTFAGTYDESEQWEEKTQDVAHEEVKDAKPASAKPATPQPMELSKKKAELIALLGSPYVDEGKKDAMIKAMPSMSLERIEKAIKNVQETINQLEENHLRELEASLEKLKSNDFYDDEVGLYISDKLKNGRTVKNLEGIIQLVSAELETRRLSFEKQQAKGRKVAS